MGTVSLNQYGDNSKPRRTGPGNSTNTSYFSQNGSQCDTYHNNIPNPVQVYTNDSRSQYSEHSNNNSSRPSRPSRPSRSSALSFRYPPGYPKQDNRQNNQGNYFVQTYNNEEICNHDFFPEYNILIKKLNDVDVHLFALCLYDSGSTSTLINEQAIPHGIIAKNGMPQTFTTTQGTYETSKFFAAEGNFFSGLL